MKKHLLPLTLILTCLFVSSSSYASYSTFSMSCGSVLKKDKEDNIYVESGITGWMMGYITARNYPNRVLTDRPDGDSVYYAVLKYCRDNPLDGVADAGEEIYSNLD